MLLGGCGSETPVGMSKLPQHLGIPADDRSLYLLRYGSLPSRIFKPLTRGVVGFSCKCTTE